MHVGSFCTIGPEGIARERASRREKKGRREREGKKRLQREDTRRGQLIPHNWKHGFMSFDRGRGKERRRRVPPCLSSFSTLSRSDFLPVRFLRSRSVSPHALTCLSFFERSPSFLLLFPYSVRAPVLKVITLNGHVVQSALFSGDSSVAAGRERPFEAYAEESRSFFAHIPRVLAILIRYSSQLQCDSLTIWILLFFFKWKEDSCFCCHFLVTSINWKNWNRIINLYSINCWLLGIYTINFKSFSLIEF